MSAVIMDGKKLAKLVKDQIAIDLKHTEKNLG
jgi:hypothetical protein